MLQRRWKYAAMIAGVAAPIYFVIQLILGSNARPSLIRALWFFLVVFLVSLAVKWEKQASAAPATSRDTPPAGSSDAEGPPRPAR